MTLAHRDTVRRGAIWPRAVLVFTGWACVLMAALVLVQQASAQTRVMGSSAMQDAPAYVGVSFGGAFGLESEYGDATRLELDTVLGLERVQKNNAPFLRFVNRQESSFVRGWLGSAHQSFYPVAFGSVPAIWGVALLDDGLQTSDAISFTAAWVTTAGSTIALKRLIKRPRPYVTRMDLKLRYPDEERLSLGDYSSTPSGHAAMSAAVATWIALESESSWVSATGGLWVGSVALSRLWKGVHYGGDVLAGGALGAALSFASRRIL